MVTMRFYTGVIINPEFLRKKLREMHIPYFVSGGLSFFDRSEIKDVMAYLRLLTNPADDNAFIRAVNTPRRGVGATTLEALATVSKDEQSNLFHAINSDLLHEHLSSSRQGVIRQFAHWVDELMELSIELGPAKTVERMLTDIQYQDWLVKQSASPEQAEMRWKNVEELVTWIRSMAARDVDRTLSDIISAITLMGKSR